MRGRCLIAVVSVFVVAFVAASELQHPVIAPIDGFVFSPAAQSKISDYDEYRFWRTDAQGHSEPFFKQGKSWDLDLSRRRAATVKAYLSLYGIADNRLTTTGFGESKPVGDNAIEEGRALNRRVELQWVGG